MSKSAKETTYNHLTYSALLLIFIIIILTFRDYGVTFDEPVQNEYGKRVLTYYTSGFEDKSYKEFYDLFLYGGLFDVLCAIVNKLSPVNEYDTRHLINALFGLIGIAGAWRLALYVGGEKAGLITVIFLTLTPSWYGHMFFNPKDIPFATGYIWSIYYLAKMSSSLPKPGFKECLKFGIATGLTLGIRSGGIILITYPFILQLIANFNSGDRINIKQDLNDLWTLLKRAVLPVFAVSWCLMSLFWPWALENPILNPLKGILSSSHFHRNNPVLFTGQIISSHELPWYYAPVTFLIKLPLPYILLLTFGLVFFISKLCKGKSIPDSAKVTTVIISVIIPVLYILLTGAVLYDGLRHLLFIIPPLIVLTALTFLKTLELKIIHPKRFIKAIYLILFALWMTHHATVVVKLHPYEYTYLNFLAGGSKEGHKNFETDYWVSSYKEAIKIIAKTIENDDVDRTYTIYANTGHFALWSQLPPFIRPESNPEKADFVVLSTRALEHLEIKGKTVGTVGRMGVPFAVIKRGVE